MIKRALKAAMWVAAYEVWRADAILTARYIRLRREQKRQAETWEKADVDV